MKGGIQIAALLIGLTGYFAPCQSLIVHTVDEQTGKPRSGVPVTIRENSLEPRGAKKGEVQIVLTDVDGKAVFQNLSLKKGEFSVYVFSMSYQGLGKQPVFFPPDEAASAKLSNPTLTSLPAEVTIQVHKRTFGEMQQLIYPGP
jgi:5-hydroxyisourate hydrolase-like protein (transthyretin family)